MALHQVVAALIILLGCCSPPVATQSDKSGKNIAQLAFEVAQQAVNNAAAIALRPFTFLKTNPKLIKDEVSKQSMSPPQSPTKRPWFRFTFPPLRPIFSQNTAVLTPAFTKVDDMLIQRTRSFWRCDKILCPVATTEYCQTMKVTSQKKKNYYERRNTCFGKNKKVLLSKSVLEKGRPYEQIHIIAELHRNGISNTQNVRNIKY